MVQTEPALEQLSHCDDAIHQLVRHCTLGLLPMPCDVQEMLRSMGLYTRLDSAISAKVPQIFVRCPSLSWVWIKDLISGFPSYPEPESCSMDCSRPIGLLLDSSQIPRRASVL